MAFRNRVVLICSLVSGFGLVSTVPHFAIAQVSDGSCPTSALKSFQRHKVESGETLERIAQLYKLDPATLIAMNPGLQGGRVAVGSVLQIPPHDGIVVEVPRGQTWRAIATRYKIRPDVLFELNGCQKNPRVVFVPSKNRTFGQISAQASNASTAKLAGYPLPELTKEALPYGWQVNPNTGKVFFHSGVELLAAKGTPVQAIGSGIVAFAGEQGTYGKLVIINHAGDLQSRYAQLDSIKVSVGQQVKKGDLVGTVGTTGTPSSNQPSLHFEVRSKSSLGWVAQDPNSYLQK
ncbi:M23 family metallopeptidase [Aetokthonos hydrillicola Thurmond2011]|jgi:lysostaphin|uniref:M23 family metallopeptidase n=1 Tax=Aetokthonos hydrillicola Thurmond2011 TaxID=2712845 RepID=A0AAP5MA86_9CYAN|nr:M23 family metallopeptidase [Aetokthonos hydrillicola]MBO3459093.1 M23 family metallopeptidase [Aetokthonos hydrillicola CCALA 1050]MBW4584733.1 M23 family metallopeptidase [Aetokthonos hydrillicola CCALA 1050]MDR9895279.1 M23 family metallopeptidase [Aetokthonos hydrillicola Thurmond2011]